MEEGWKEYVQSIDKRLETIETIVRDLTISNAKIAGATAVASFIAILIIDGIRIWVDKF